MAGIQGLSGLAAVENASGQPGYYTEGWVDPYQEYASPADQVHYGDLMWESPPPMPWLYGPEYFPPAPPELGTGQVPGELPAGTDAALAYAPEETGSHHAPWPAFGVEDSDPHLTEYNQAQLQESASIHAADTGQAGIYLHGIRGLKPWHRQDINYLSAGETMLTPDVPDQLRGNMGLDHTQGFEPDARYGFNQGFIRMPSASSDVAGNFMWLDPALRPVEVRPAGVRHWPVGQDSPFAGQVPGSSGGAGYTVGAVVDTVPPEYVPPPDPQVGPALADSSPSWSTW